jgi:hypothetical protein
MDRAVSIRERAGLLAPDRRRKHHVGEPGGLGQKRILNDHEQILFRQNLPDARQLRKRDSGVGATDPEQTNRALLGISPDLHGVRRWRPMGDDHRIDVPERGELLDVGLIVPVAEAGEVAIGAGLSRVLRGRLPVHLEETAPRSPDHAAQQMEIVDLDRRGGCLVRLVNSLEHARDESLSCAEDARGLADLLHRHAADLGSPFR